ncbi:MAG: hypothetical protein FWE03_04695 [Firmicutes bacterium]|nr:hypothetical protein [Bacillota bacterium]
MDKKDMEEFSDRNSIYIDILKKLALDSKHDKTGRTSPYRGIISSAKEKRTDRRRAKSDSELKIRDEIYTDILEDAFERTKETKKTNKFFKAFFFWTVMGLLVGQFIATTVVAVIIINIFRNYGFSGEGVAVLIAPLVTLATSIVVLPKIIATYLFPKEEFTQYTDIIKAIVLRDNSDEDKKK